MKATSIVLISIIASLPYNLIVRPSELHPSETFSSSHSCTSKE